MKKLYSAMRIFLCYFISLSLTMPAYAGSTITYIHNDIAGTPVAASDSAGNLLWKENYYPYGEQRTHSGDSTNEVWFHGKPLDPGTGLSYFGARYYDPALGRFMGMDPVGVNPKNLSSFNKYAYANNNPNKYIDPDGRNGVAIALFGLAALVLFIAAGPQGGRSRQVGPYRYDPPNTPRKIPGWLSSEAGDEALPAAGGDSNSSSSPGIPPEDDDRRQKTPHGEQRAEEAKYDAKRSVGDSNRVIRDGRKFIDGDTGNTVHVDGDRVAITNKRDELVTQFRNSRANTLSRIKSGRWVPKD